MKVEELEKMAFKCMECNGFFFVDEQGYFRKVKLGEDFMWSGMTLCPDCRSRRGD